MLSKGTSAVRKRVESAGFSNHLCGCCGVEVVSTDDLADFQLPRCPKCVLAQAPVVKVSMAAWKAQKAAKRKQPDTEATDCSNSDGDEHGATAQSDRVSDLDDVELRDSVSSEESDWAGAQGNVVQQPPARKSAGRSTRRGEY